LRRQGEDRSRRSKLPRDCVCSCVATYATNEPLSDTLDSVRRTLMKLDTMEVEQVADPLERALAIDETLAEAERLVEYLKALRATAMREHAHNVGGNQAAKDLNLSRASMYRAIRRGVSSDQLDHDEPHWQQEAQALNERLQRNGKTREGINVWWNLTIQPRLGGRTPLQAWLAGDRDSVLALVQ